MPVLLREFHTPEMRARTVVPSALALSQVSWRSLLLAAVLARALRQQARHILDHRAWRPLQNCFEGDVELILKFLGGPSGISSRTSACQKRLQGTGLLVFIPSPIPNEFNKVGPGLAGLPPYGLFDLPQLMQWTTETKGNV